jgi:ABC-type nitrate/sulfonate/bicarbonate transport system substrate-binding protein
MKRTTTALVGLAAAVALTLSACSTGTSTPKATATSGGKLAATVRIIQGGSEDFSDAAINKATDLLNAEGIAVQSSTVDDPATALRAVIAGQADIALLDPVEAVKAVANGGAPIKYIGSLSQGTDYVVLSLPGVSLGNLDGKKFATAGAGTAGDVIASAALAKKNVDMSQVQKVTVGGTSARVTAILSGQVDMAPVHAADSVPAVKTGKVKVLLNTGKVLGSYLQQGMIASNTFIKDKATTQAVVNAFLDAERWAVGNQTQYIALAGANQLLGDLTPSQAKTAYNSLNTSKIFATNGAICQTAINQTLKYDYEVPGGGLTKSNTPSYSTWVDPAFVNSYLKQKGKNKDGYC